MSKGILKDIIIVAIGVIVIWISLQVVFGTQNPFYVVASGSMIPVLEVYDVLIVQGHVPFEDIKVGDIIVFNRPTTHDRVIVHRVASIIDDEPKTIRTKGDANPASIPGTDFPITKEDYIGKVAYVIPQLGYVTQLLKPPINYIIIVIVVGIMIVKQVYKKKNEKEIAIQDIPDPNDSQIESTVDIPELEKLEKDKEYSKHEESKLPQSEESEKDQK
ncbi:peptidase S26B, signal peptidase [Candidatus Nitrosarchaeum limnium SFB1]|uniref:Peptidase S26B, signal peptidase n=1 Tax=Candidatus Nitrosarchaeum limnium SFB1 TaxID=886738 RepID=F3KL78_9ARCH|nr:peptidase S26B, signal peptidase [Candidatus Nitrosarchaeum limnium SFB1]